MAFAAARHAFRRWRIARTIRAARDRGHGLYFHEWHRPSGNFEGLSADVVEWCRHTLALCRRPMGIDHFDLTLTIEGHGPSRTHRMGFLRPGQLYDDAGLPVALENVFTMLGDEGADSPVKVVAALLSWGDVAYVSMPS